MASRTTATVEKKNPRQDAMLNKSTRDRLRRLNRHRNGKAAKAATASPTTSSPDKSVTPDASTPDESLPNRMLRQRLAGATGKLARKSHVLPSPAISPLSTGREVVNDAGRHWLVERRLDDLWPDAEQHMTAWEQLPPRPAPTGAPKKISKTGKPAQKKPTASKRKQHEDYESFRASFPHHCVFLDLETCGLAGSAIFLAGLLHTDHNGQWRLAQFWARNYAEERSMLASVKQCLCNRRVLITFNGKSFDWPQVRDRCTLHAGTADCGLPELVHVDLLHLARQRWRSILPDCKLQTLERFICGRHRAGDIPGREIPAAYDEYVRSGSTGQMDSVLHHNALDLITLLEVAMRWDDRELPRRNVG